MSTRVYVGVGSNIDARTHVLSGLRRLDEAGPIVAMSPFWRTTPIDRPEQEDYVNGVVALEGNPDDWWPTLRIIETAEGRVRTDDAYAARTLDLDIIAYEEGGQLAVEPEARTRPWLRHGLALLAGLEPDARDPGPLVEWATLDAVRAQSD